MLLKKNYWISLITILSLTSNLILADQVIYLEPTTPAPFAGYLFPPKEAKELRLKILDNETNSYLVDSYKKSLNLSEQLNNLNDKKLQLCITQVDTLAKTTVEERDFNDWKKLGWFGVGVLTTILTLYGVSKAINR